MTWWFSELHSHSYCWHNHLNGTMAHLSRRCCPRLLISRTKQVKLPTLYSAVWQHDLSDLTRMTHGYVSLVTLNTLLIEIQFIVWQFIKGERRNLILFPHCFKLGVLEQVNDQTQNHCLQIWLLNDEMNISYQEPTVDHLLSKK